MMDRWCVLNIKPDLDKWLTWSYANGVHPSVVEHISANEALFCSAKDQKSAGGGKTPTPRGWKRVSDTIKVLEGKHEDLLMECVAGWVGQEAAVSLMKYRKEKFAHPVTATEVLEKYASIKDKLLKQSVAATHATVSQLVGVLESYDFGASKTKGKEAVDSLRNFLLDVKEEHGVAVLTAINDFWVKKQGKNVNLITKIVTPALTNKYKAMKEELDKYINAASTVQ
jgi:hypothetical protein